MVEGKVRKLENGKIVVETTHVRKEEYTKEEIQQQVSDTETKLARLKKSLDLFK